MLEGDFSGTSRDRGKTFRGGRISTSRTAARPPRPIAPRKGSRESWLPAPAPPKPARRAATLELLPGAQGVAAAREVPDAPPEAMRSLYTSMRAFIAASVRHNAISEREASRGGGLQEFPRWASVRDASMHAARPLGCDKREPKHEMVRQGNTRPAAPGSETRPARARCPRPTDSNASAWRLVRPKRPAKRSVGGGGGEGGC